MNDGPGPKVEAAQLAAFASGIASGVGREARRRARDGFTWATKSSETDVVTEIDEWSERRIVETIARERPDDGLRGEEGTNKLSTSGVTWVIDPIDGTTNLLYDLPGYSVSIAASVAGEAIAGAVYDPIRDELFVAALGQGATRNGSPISASAKSDLGTALIGTGFSYDSTRRAEQAHVLTTLLPNVRDIRRLGGAALDLCSVACGRLDAYYERGLSEWDYAAGALIAGEAGAVTATGPLTTAAAPALDADFQRLLHDATPDH